MGVKLLDCTLRDGGHLNKSKFGEAVIGEIICGLEKTRVDYIEIGFLREENIGTDHAAADAIGELEERFCLTGEDTTEYAVMIQEDQYPVDKLPPYRKGLIRRIRVSFHDYDKEAGLEYCREVLKRGYICHVNPINITGYDDREVLELVHEVNTMEANVFTLVDTFGSMTKDDLVRLFSLVDNNLSTDIAIGFHLHDNMQMAFSHAQMIVESASAKREIIIDGSLLGMGREPGNLCIELMMEYLNRKTGSLYDVNVALDLIDVHIMRLKEKYPWGYETAYALSAQYKLHRTYAEYLIKKQKLKTKQIKQILGMVERSKRSRYDERYIEQLYNQVVNTEIDDSIFRDRLREEIGQKKVLLVASGRSLGTYAERLKTFCQENDLFIITANFKTAYFCEDYVFCSNIKRLDRLKECVAPEKIILTPYLQDLQLRDANRVNANELGRFGETFWDNCMLLLLNLIMKIGIKECYIAGWDGFSKENNFIDRDMESIYHYEDENVKVIDILHNYFKEMNLRFLTPSLYWSEESK